jgi:hypothetical protein
VEVEEKASGAVRYKVVGCPAISSLMELTTLNGVK